VKFNVRKTEALVLACTAAIAGIAVADVTGDLTASIADAIALPH
jgi:hypothetical protein